MVFYLNRRYDTVPAWCRRKTNVLIFLCSRTKRRHDCRKAAECVETNHQPVPSELDLGETEVSQAVKNWMSSRHLRVLFVHKVKSNICSSYFTLSTVLPGGGTVRTETPWLTPPVRQQRADQQSLPSKYESIVQTRLVEV